MPFAKRKALVVAWVVACVLVGFPYTSAQQPSIQQSAITVTLGEVAPRSKPKKGTPGYVIPVDVKIPVSEKSNPLATDSHALTYVAAQTWFSTEPLILPKSNFVFEGSTKDHPECAKSKPIMTMSPPTLVDAFCVYGATFSLKAFYSTTAADGQAPAQTAQTGPQDPSHAVSTSTDQPPVPVPAQTERALPVSDGGQGDEQSQVPLTYRGDLGAREETFMYLLRPFLQPNATSISFTDQVGINGLPRWSLGITANPTWIPWLDAQERQEKTLSYLSLNVNVNLNNQINANPNSTVGALQWNWRTRYPLAKHWLRKPGLDVSLSGVEYDFVSNDINLYYPSASVKWPLAALDYKGNPAVFVWKLQLGEISGYHVHDPSAAGLAGMRSVAADIADEGTRLFRGVAVTTVNVQGWGTWLGSFGINSSYQAMVPVTDEPFTIPSSSSSKPPTITLTDKTRHFVKSAITEKLGSSNFSFNVTYQYGSLPPAFWLVKHSLSVGLTLSSGNGRFE